MLFIKKLYWKVKHYFNNRKTDKIMAQKLCEILPLLPLPDDEQLIKNLNEIHEYYLKKIGG